MAAFRILAAVRLRVARRRLRLRHRAGGGAPPWAYVPRASNVPSLFASRSTVMVFVPGELTKRSPFGAYAIMRGDGSSA